MKYKDIPNCSNYLISDTGQVLSKKKQITLKGEVSSVGYIKVILTDDDGKRRTINVHRLVAAAFCRKLEGQDEVNHINGVKTDNRACNLEWVSRAGNLKHAYESGLMPFSTVPKKVVATDMKTGEETLFSSIYKAAHELGISQGNICMCCKGRRPYANGFYWSYA